MINYKIKKILVPFDFSNSSLNALKVADKFANEFNAKIHLLNIIEPFLSQEPARFNSGQLANMYKYKIESAEAVEDYILKNFINPSAYSYQTCYGFCSSTIIDFAKNGEYDLIVLPDDSKGFFSRAISKYRPLKIMEQTNIPVICVNKFYRTIDFRNIIIPIRNLANWYEKIPFMVALAKQTGGKIHAIGMNEKNSSSNSDFDLIFDKAISILEEQNVLSTTKRFEGVTSLKELIAYSEKQKADLIAITPSKSKTLLTSIIYPSLYSRLIFNSPAPVFGVQLT
ncbi:MAG: universal stress protein [Bacteroidetes bacterium]|nr:universal stress protein [Bacteroidota bacterium]